MSAELCRVVLSGVPLRLSQQAETWFDGLVREFQIIATGADAVPDRLLRFVETVRAEFPEMSGLTREEVEAALEQGEENVDIDIAVPKSAAQWSAALWDHIVEANEYCRSGQLLSMEAPPDVLGLLNWYLHEVIGQIGGAEPTPWKDSSAAQLR